MTTEIESLIDKYWDEDEHKKIVELILSIPEEKRDIELLGQLVVAYNNLDEFDLAISLSHEIEEESRQLPSWYYRIGYALIGKQDYLTAAKYLKEGIYLSYDQNDNDRCKNCYGLFHKCLPHLPISDRQIFNHEEPIEILWSEDNQAFRVVKGIVNLGYMGTFVPHQMSLDFDKYDLPDIFEGEYDNDFLRLSEYIKEDMSNEELAKGISKYLNLRLKNMKEHITEINQAFLSNLILNDMVGCGFHFWDECLDYVITENMPICDRNELESLIYSEDFSRNTYKIAVQYYEKPMNGSIDNTTYVEDFLKEHLAMFDYRRMLLDVHSQYLSLGVNSIAIQCDGEGDAGKIACCACAEFENDNSIFDWHNF
ncbi:MAG: hypothetical protein IKK33_13210 [Lachnospiraceae bacterium]|nr:hypothetical protein [Lachnospiraceae bacterium]